MPNQPTTYGGHPTRYEWLKSAIESHNSDDCLLWPFRSKHTYPDITVGGILWKAHRLAFKLAHGYTPEPMGLHTCDQPKCVNPRHIFQGNQHDNMADMARKNRGVYKLFRGEDSCKAKLTEQDVLKIREEFGKIPQWQIALKYGITRSNVSYIGRGKSWSHVSQFLTSTAEQNEA